MLRKEIQHSSVEGSLLAVLTLEEVKNCNSRTGRKGLPGDETMCAEMWMQLGDGQSSGLVRVPEAHGREVILSRTPTRHEVTVR